MKGLINCFLFIVLFCNAAIAQQNVTGEWYGVGYVKKYGEHNSYLAEMILKQKGTKVTGTFNYYFRTDSFSTSVRGEYHEGRRWLQLFASPVLNYQAKTKNGAQCPMEGDFTLMASVMETTLTGQFSPTYAARILCPAINIKFVKFKRDTTVTDKLPDEDTVTAITPALVDTIIKPVQPPKDSIKLPVKADTTTAKPARKDTFKIAQPVVIVKKDTVPAAKVIIKPAAPNADTVKQQMLAQDTIKASVPIVSIRDSARLPFVIKRPVNPNEKYIRELYRRTFSPVVTNTLELEADSLTISFYDNGEIDGDTISVFYNRKPLVLSQLLSAKPVTIKLRLDTAISEISMFAENLGRIPPNTAVAIITAGTQRFELNLSSSMLSNATVRFRKKPRVKDPKNIN